MFFATPSFCQSGVCGPTVEMVKAVMASYRGVVDEDELRGALEDVTTASQGG